MRIKKNYKKNVYCLICKERIKRGEECLVLKNEKRFHLICVSDSYNRFFISERKRRAVELMKKRGFLSVVDN